MDCIFDGGIIEIHGEHRVMRGDLWRVGGAIGGKARTCWYLAQGAKGLVTSGSRASPQANIVAQVAQRLGIPCRVHTPEGTLSPELLLARKAGAVIVQHKAGYNNVIIARAREDAKMQGWINIPFGMECQEAVEQTAKQVACITHQTQRIIIPVGSGMSLAGLLHGLNRRNLSIPVLGVVVGASPERRLKKFAPFGWRNAVTLVPSGSDYHKPAVNTMLGDLHLDSHYEAKCLPFLQPDDLMWVVGVRASESTV